MSKEIRNPSAKRLVKRRMMLKSVVAGGGAVTIKGLPGEWAKPVVDSVIIPSHAATTGTSTQGGTTAPPGSTTRPPVCDVVCRVSTRSQSGEGFGNKTFTSPGGTYSYVGTGKTNETGKLFVDAIEFEVDPPGCITGLVDIDVSIQGDANDDPANGFDAFTIAPQIIGDDGKAQFGTAAYDHFYELADSGGSKDGTDTTGPTGFDDGFTITLTPQDAAAQACTIAINIAEQT